MFLWTKICRPAFSWINVPTVPGWQGIAMNKHMYWIALPTAVHLASQPRLLELLRSASIWIRNGWIVSNLNLKLTELNSMNVMIVSTVTVSYWTLTCNGNRYLIIACAFLTFVYVSACCLNVLSGFDWLEKLSKRGEKFDIVILDPPSSSVGKKKRRWSVRNDMDELVALAAPLVKKGGLLWTTTNSAAIPPIKFARLCKKGLDSAGLRSAKLERIQPMPVDFPSIGPNPVKNLVWRL